MNVSVVLTTRDADPSFAAACAKLARGQSRLWPCPTAADLTRGCAAAPRQRCRSPSDGPRCRSKGRDAVPRAFLKRSRLVRRADISRSCTAASYRRIGPQRAAGSGQRAAGSGQLPVSNGPMARRQPAAGSSSLWRSLESYLGSLVSKRRAALRSGGAPSSGRRWRGRWRMPGRRRCNRRGRR